MSLFVFDVENRSGDYSRVVQMLLNCLIVTFFLLGPFFYLFPRIFKVNYVLTLYV